LILEDLAGYRLPTAQSSPARLHYLWRRPHLSTSSSTSPTESYGSRSTRILLWAHPRSTSRSPMWSSPTSPARSSGSKGFQRQWHWLIRWQWRWETLLAFSGELFRHLLPSDLVMKIHSLSSTSSIYIYIYIILHILPPRTLNLMLEIKVSLNSVSPFKKVGYFVDYIWSFELDLKVNVRGKVGRNEYKESSSNDFWCQRQIKIQEFDEQFFSIYKILDSIPSQSLLFWLQSICRLIFFRNYKKKSVMLNNTYHTNILKI